MRMKKLLALLLVVVFVLTALVACGDENKDESKDQSANTSQNTSDTTGEVSESSDQSNTDPYSHLRGFDLDSAVIKILVYDDSRARYKSVEIMEHNDNPDAINTAISERNAIVENLLNCKLEEVRVPDVLTTATNDVLAGGGGEYDLIMPYMPAAATLAQQGYLYDLYEFSDIIKFENSYWDQRANKDLSIANKLYFSTGDFSLLTFDCTHAIVFNKNLVQTTPTVEDPYELLREGKWTLDALLRNAKKVTADTDGQEGMTFLDTWGLFLNNNYTTTMFVGSGERLIDKDGDDLPIVVLDSERAGNVASKIREIYNEKTSTIIIENISNLGGKYPDVYFAASAAIGEDRALFRTCAVVDLNELTDYSVPYGILPTPKYNESQEEYYNIVSAILASCIAIHNNVKDPEASAAVAEALAATSTDTLRKAYYEVVLKTRKFNDEEDEYALDVIFNNRLYEMATIYDFGDLSNLIIQASSSAGDTFRSSYDAIKDIVEDKIETLKEAFAD